MSLGQRFVRGSASLGGAMIAANAVNLGLQLVIARLLGPAEFGIYAFCVAIDQLPMIVGAFSLAFALIQSREATQEDYDTALVAYAAFAGLGALISAGLAVWLYFERSPRAAGVLLVLAGARAFRLFSQIPVARLERGVRYGALSVIEIFVSVVPNLVAVGLAWGAFGAWSLGIRDLLVTVLYFGLSWAVAGHRFGGRVTRRAWRRLMRFSGPVFVSRTIEIVLERLDTLAVGLLLGNRATGLYHQARFVSEAGVVATRSVERTSFNLYARVREDPPRLARAFELVSYVLLRVMLAGSAVLIVFPHETVRLLLGEAWEGLAPLLRWLALYGGLWPLFNNAKFLCYALGEAGRIVRVRSIQGAFFIAAVVAAGAAGSAEAMAAGLLLTSLLALGLAWRAIARLVALPPARALATPLCVLAGTSALLLLPGGADVAAALPWPLRPLLPVVVYVLGLLAMERGTLVREVRFLLVRLRASDAEEPRPA